MVMTGELVVYEAHNLHTGKWYAGLGRLQRVSVSGTLLIYRYTRRGLRADTIPTYALVSLSVIS
jgi:hypothetical protein